MQAKLFGCAASIGLLGILACDNATNPPGTPVDLTYRPCTGAADAPSWLAVQDGDGSWERINSTSGAFNFTISAGRGGIAMFNDQTGLFIVYATTAEFQETFSSCTGSLRDVTGSVTGYTSADRVRLTVGGGYDEFNGTSFPAPTAWGVPDVEPSASDIVAIRYRLGGGTTTTLYEEFPDRVFLRRGVTGSSTSSIDLLSATEAAAPLQRTLAVTNMVSGNGGSISGEQLIVSSNVALATTVAKIAFYNAPPASISGTLTAPYYGVAGARLTSGESQVIGVSASRTVGSANESRFITAVYTDPIDRSMTFGPALGGITVTGTSRPTATYTVQSEYDNLFEVVFSQATAAADILATKGYLGSSSGSSVTLAVPNLSGVSGFSSAWTLAPGVTSNWHFLATNSSISILTTQALTYQGAERSANFVP